MDERIAAELKGIVDGDGRLTKLPSKRKKLLYAVHYLAGKFEPNRRYTEREVNDLLCEWHTFGDPATLRRELYNGRYLDREPNGASYWLEEHQPTLEELEKKFG